MRENGEPTGLLQERALEALNDAMPAPSVEELVEAIELAGKRCLSYGIGSVMDACVGMIGGWSDVAAYEAAERAGRLPVRMTMAMGGGGPPASPRRPSPRATSRARAARCCGWDR